MNYSNKNINYIDSVLLKEEQLPKSFEVVFKEVINERKEFIRVSVNGTQIGDIIDDNSYENDFYRYHDVFHYTFATMLDWSPCTRVMLKRKRKSMPTIDEYEDGARATITEEAISLIIFNEAKRTNFFQNKEVNKTILGIIKQMTEPFEVRNKTKKEWELAILKGYELFKKLISNKGGKIIFNASERSATYSS